MHTNLIKLNLIRYQFSKFYSPTTSKYPTWLFMGSVLIWHMYHPLSASRTSRICKYHDRWSLCVTPMRWFLVITWLWMVRMVCVSTRSHATCNNAFNRSHTATYTRSESAFAPLNPNKCKRDLDTSH